MGWFKEGIYKRVGDGRHVSFWNEPWVDKACLKLKFPRLFCMSANQEAKVADMGEWRMIAGFGIYNGEEASLLGKNPWSSNCRGFCLV